VFLSHFPGIFFQKKFKGHFQGAFSWGREKGADARVGSLGDLGSR
jgi:hypothetical protein